MILAEKGYLFRDSPRPRRGCRLLRPDLASGLCQELCTKGWRVNTGAGGTWTRQRKTNIASINNRSSNIATDHILSKLHCLLAHDMSRLNIAYLKQYMRFAFLIEHKIIVEIIGESP